MEWVLKHNNSMKTGTWSLKETRYDGLQYKGPWVMDDYLTSKPGDEGTLPQWNGSWSFNEDADNGHLISQIMLIEISNQYASVSLRIEK
ncbi:hypothetical protein EJB05_26058, partial [Eragrostis curvula]